MSCKSWGISGEYLTTGYSYVILKEHIQKNLNLFVILTTMIFQIKNEVFKKHNELVKEGGNNKIIYLFNLKGGSSPSIINL